MVQLVYKALRVLAYIIIAIALVVILSKILPIIGDIFLKIHALFKTLISVIENLAQTLVSK